MGEFHRKIVIMISGYTVGVRIALEDLVSAPLLRISEQFKAIDLSIKGITANLRGIGLESNALRGLSNSALALDKNLSAANLQTERLEKNLAAVKALGMSGPVAPGVLPGGRGRGGYGGGRHGGVHVGSSGVGISGVAFGLGDAMIPLAVGAAAVYGTSKFYDAAKDYQTEVARLTMFGLDKTQMASAEAYINNLKTHGTSKAQNMRFFTEAQGVFRESGLRGEEALTGAKMATPLLSKIYYATEALDDETKSTMRTSSMAMLRFIEQMGGVRDVKTFNKYAEGGFKAIRASGGVVDWEQYRQFAARGGIATQYIDPDVLFGQLEPIIGELKGSTAGFSMRTAYNRLNGIVKIPNQVAHILTQSGLWDGSKIDWNSQGGIKRFNGNPLSAALNHEFLHRPVDFYEKEIMPIYAKMNNGKGLTLEERGRENALIFGSTGGNMFTKIDQQLTTLKKSAEAYKKTLGIGDATAVTNKTAAGSEAQFTAAWTDFKNEFGKNVLPPITEMLKTGTVMLRGLSWFHANYKLDLLAPVKEAPRALSDAANYVKGLVFGPKQTTDKGGDVWMDGHKVGHLVSKHQAKAASRNMQGTTRHDGNMSLQPVGATGGF